MSVGCFLSESEFTELKNFRMGARREVEEALYDFQGLDHFVEEYKVHVIIACDPTNRAVGGTPTAAAIRRSRPSCSFYCSLPILRSFNALINSLASSAD